MSWDDLLEAAERIRATTVTADPRLAELPLVGIGWATVEGERAMRELDARFPAATAHGRQVWRPAARDEDLGALAWVRIAAGDEPASIVVLEPDTEGRLAASLARWGEGVAAIYLGPPADPAGSGVPHARGGPLGLGRLVRGGPAWGPHVVVLEGGVA